jgi:hypothetical protein
MLVANYNVTIKPPLDCNPYTKNLMQIGLQSISFQLAIKFFEIN